MVVGYRCKQGVGLRLPRRTLVTHGSLTALNSAFWRSSLEAPKRLLAGHEPVKVKQPANGSL